MLFGLLGHQDEVLLVLDGRPHASLPSAQRTLHS